MLINWLVITILQCIHRSNHLIVHFKYNYIYQLYLSRARKTKETHRTECCQRYKVQGEQKKRRTEPRLTSREGDFSKQVSSKLRHGNE